LYKLYGNEIFDAVKGSGEEFMSVDAQSGKYGPYDRDNDGISSSVDQDDDGDGMLDLNIDVMSEEEMMSVYDDTSNLTSDLETDKVKRGQTVGVKDNKGTVRTITVNESTRSLLKKFINTRK
jgi:hypothetical protein